LLIVRTVALSEKCADSSARLVTKIIAFSVGPVLIRKPHDGSETGDVARRCNQI